MWLNDYSCQVSKIFNEECTNYSGASFIRTLWFPVKIVQIGEASGYLKCIDLSLKKKIQYVCIV